MKWISKILKKEKVVMLLCTFVLLTAI